MDRLPIDGLANIRPIASRLAASLAVTLRNRRHGIS